MDMLATKNTMYPVNYQEIPLESPVLLPLLPLHMTISDCGDDVTLQSWFFVRKLCVATTQLKMFLKTLMTYVGHVCTKD